VAWQIRTGRRHHGAKLYILNSQPSKLERLAEQAIRVAADGEGSAVQWLARGRGSLASEVLAELAKLKSSLEAASDVVIVFGAALAGPAIRNLVAFGSRLAGRTRYMALGDYANSRGAADFGVLPDRLPGYAPLADAAERARFSKLWGGEIPASTGLTAKQMMDAAVSGKLKALYVVGANPVKTFGAKSGEKLGKLDLLVVHDLFLTETSKLADVLLPAASSYEKDGTITSTSGEVQLTHRSIDPQGPRSDFDLIRILSYQLSQLGMGPATRHRTPESAFDEIRQHVAGYALSYLDLLAGEADRATPGAIRVDDSYDVPPKTIFSSHDSLFSSGTLGRYCSKLNSCNEAKDIPWSSPPNIRSWWYR